MRKHEDCVHMAHSLAAQVHEAYMNGDTEAYSKFILGDGDLEIIGPTDEHKSDAVMEGIQIYYRDIEDDDIIEGCKQGFRNIMQTGDVDKISVGLSALMTEQYLEKQGESYFDICTKQFIDELATLLHGFSSHYEHVFRSSLHAE